MIKVYIAMVLTSLLLHANIQYSQAILDKKIYPMGKKIYKSKCKNKIDIKKYITIEQLEQSIVNDKLCKKLKGKKLHALSLYLWSLKSNKKDSKYNKTIKLKPKEKCPVCGMFVYKYPKWVAQIVYTKNGHQHRLSFDGVKDLMKFYFEPQAWGKYDNFDIKNIGIIVTDYYTQKPIDGFKAYYVLRSDVYGPMGHELIPFKAKKDAKTFRLDHNAKYIITFEQITQKGVYELDE